MSTIRETVEGSLQSNGLSGYTGQARPVITALEQREEQIKTGLRNFASQRGLSGQQITDLFIQVGLEQRPTPVASHPTTPGDDRAILDRIDSLERSVRSLTEAARSRGLTV